MPGICKSLGTAFDEGSGLPAYGSTILENCNVYEALHALPMPAGMADQSLNDVKAALLNVAGRPRSVEEGGARPAGVRQDRSHRKPVLDEACPGTRHSKWMQTLLHSG